MRIAIISVIALLFFSCSKCGDITCEGCVAKEDISILDFTNLDVETDTLVIQKMTMVTDSLGIDSLITLFSDTLMHTELPITLDHLEDLERFDTLFYQVIKTRDTVAILKNLAISYQTKSNECCSCTKVTLDSLQLNDSIQVTPSTIPVLF